MAILLALIKKGFSRSLFAEPAGQEKLVGCTFHGLRKTLGKYLAEEGATAKQAASILGHDVLDHLALYSREAEQERLAVDGLTRLVAKYG